MTVNSVRHMVFEVVGLVKPIWCSLCTITISNLDGAVNRGHIHYEFHKYL